jgi:hypothetical protein
MTAMQLSAAVAAVMSNVATGNAVIGITVGVAVGVVVKNEAAMKDKQTNKQEAAGEFKAEEKKSRNVYMRVSSPLAVLCSLVIAGAVLLLLLHMHKLAHAVPLTVRTATVRTSLTYQTGIVKSSIIVDASTAYGRYDTCARVNESNTIVNAITGNKLNTIANASIGNKIYTTDNADTVYYWYDT